MPISWNEIKDRAFYSFPSSCFGNLGAAIRQPFQGEHKVRPYEKYTFDGELVRAWEPEKLRHLNRR